MTRRRRTFTSELKAEAVLLVTVKSYSVAEACRSLDICVSLLRSGIAALLENGPDTFPGNGRLNPHVDEDRRLRAEN